MVQVAALIVLRETHYNLTLSYTPKAGRYDNKLLRLCLESPLLAYTVIPDCMRAGMREFRYPPGVDPWFKIGMIQPVTISLGIPDHRTHQPHTLSDMTAIFF